MPLFNRKNINEQKIDPSGFLNEYGIGSTDGINMYNFIQGMRSLDSNYTNYDSLIDRMTQDSIISSAIDMWTEDALQRDPQSKEIFYVELNTPDDYVETELSKGLSIELDRFLKDDLRMEKNLIPIIKRVLTYGNCPLKLDFADELVDDQLKLKESAKDNFQIISNKLSNMFINKDKKAIDDKSLLENEEYQVDWEASGEDIIPMSHPIFESIRKANTINSKKIKSLQEGEVLKEDSLIDTKRMVKGRWFTEHIGHGTNIYELTSKQKLIAYMDRDNPDKFIKPDRIVNFSNNTGKHKVIFEVGGFRDAADKKKHFSLERGESFIENAMVAWQVLAALEDILLLTRMTRSILYRIFSVEVGNKGNKETKETLERLKNKIKMDETVNVREKIYNSSLTQVPLGDSIFIPTRSGVGVIDVKTVGGDINLHDAIDLDYFKDKLFAGLRIPAPFLGFTESLPGGIGDTSLTRMDIRYSRTITRIQSIIAEGLKDLCLLYLKFTRTEKAFNELPDFKIVFTSINSAEDISRADLKQKQMDTLNNVLTSLKNLGVDLAANSEGYENTRQQLIKEYFGSVLLDKILKDEKTMPVQGPTEGNPNDLHNKSDFGEGRPNDIISGPSNLGGEEPEDEELENELDNDEETVEPEETENNVTDETRELT